MIQRCRAIYGYLRQSTKVFVCCLWFIILLWVAINLGVAFGFYDWDLNMYQERKATQEHLGALQDYITDHAGPSFE